MARSSDQIFDELLVIRCQENDREAIGLLWKRWQPRMLKWAFSHIQDQNYAYEAVQESWLSIIKGIYKLKDPALFRFWAYRIVQRRSVDMIRQLQKERKVIDEQAQEVHNSEDQTGQEPDKAKLMLETIRQLPRQQQEMLRLFYLEKYPVKVIARFLELPVGTVKSRLFYARQQLKEKLKEVHHE